MRLSCWNDWQFFNHLELRIHALSCTRWEIGVGTSSVHKTILLALSSGIFAIFFISNHSLLACETRCTVSTVLAMQDWSCNIEHIGIPYCSFTIARYFLIEVLGCCVDWYVDIMTCSWQMGQEILIGGEKIFCCSFRSFMGCANWVPHWGIWFLSLLI